MPIEEDKIISKRSISGGVAIEAFAVIGLSSFLSKDENSVSDIPAAASISEAFMNVVKDPNPSERNAAMPVADSHGQSIMLGQTLYNPIGRLLLEGENSCTATIIEMPEKYELVQSGVLIQTAAHCVFNNLNKLEGDISVAVNFVNAQIQEEIILYTNPQIWFDERYLENARRGINPYKDGEDSLVYSSHDKALLFFPNQTLPAEINPIDMFVLEDGNNQVSASFNSINVTAAGYSFNILGLSADGECQIVGSRYSVLRSDCIISNGASGSPILITQEDGSLMSVGVASKAGNYYKDDGSVSDYSFFRASDFVRNWPEFFVEPEGDIELEDHCMRVTAQSNLRVRSGPSGSDLQIGSLPFNSVVRVNPDDTHNGWIAIKGYQSGYSSMEYLVNSPCP